MAGDREGAPRVYLRGSVGGDNRHVRGRDCQASVERARAALPITGCGPSHRWGQWLVWGDVPASRRQEDSFDDLRPPLQAGIAVHHQRRGPYDLGRGVAGPRQGLGGCARPAPHVDALAGRNDVRKLVVAMIRVPMRVPP